MNNDGIRITEAPKKRKKKKKPSKPSGLRQYWPHLTLAECEIERQKLFDKQDGRCAICRKPESYFSKRLACEHDHKTGLVRGLACFRCNRFLIGKFRLVTILPVFEYLAVHELKDDLKEKCMAILQEIRKETIT